MKHLEEIEKKTLSLSVLGDSVHVEASLFCIVLYVNGKCLEEIEVPSEIISLSYCKDVYVLIKDGILVYRYCPEKKTLVSLDKHKVLGIVSGMSDKCHIVTRESVKGKTRNMLWCLCLGRSFLLDYPCTPDDPKLIEHMESVSHNELLLFYSQSMRKVSYSQIHHQWISSYEKKQEKKRIFLDKRNMLIFHNKRIHHMQVIPHTEMARGAHLTLLHKSNGCIVVQIDEDIHVIEKNMDRFSICTEHASSFDLSMHCNSSTNPPFSIFTKDNILFVDGLPYIRNLTRSKFFFCTGFYIFQLNIQGCLRIFILKNKKAVLHREISGIKVENLLSLDGWCTKKSTLLLMQYTTHAVVLEYFTKLRIKEEIEIESIPEKITRYRQSVLVEYKENWTRYFLGKDKTLQMEIISKLDISIKNDKKEKEKLFLGAHNRNQQLKKIYLYKKDKQYICELNREEILNQSFIQSIHLLYTGYVFSDGFSLYFSNGKSINLLIAIREVQVYNEVHMSMILVHLTCGSIHIIYVEKDTIKRGEMHHRISPERIEVLSLSSFLTIEREVLTVYECTFTSSSFFAIPTTRVAFPFFIEDVLLSSEGLIVLKNGSLFSLHPWGVAESSIPLSIGVSI
ncbi:hypothetical protein NEFER03_1341 [Nematocida sp. LUAm3]|nr:hypothetical protein NEFER03_1341 [Nematocida sp. LUAm3]KAI5174037.1 hypothetical protein NEFER02_0504 [Nematocida sp. LUAm2]KAI5177220.1 hypothetical protein NEFER01_0495 [Nematocida sp. LUAm1]